MAKSLRSRWKRKCRAIKRERYAVKELARLKKMLGVKDEEKPETTTDEVMESDQVIFLDAGALKKNAEKKNKKKKEKEIAEEAAEDVEMSSDDENVVVDGDGKKRVFSTKTLKDQNGQYPVWLHKRKIAKLNKTGKKNTKKRSKNKKRKRL
ncbi:protein LLP homolog [Spodoptera frugiperda]|uniref:Protein LLP homolog n=1 Tax=Spodoptera frugiperda TaxID=7108 RepID=A0A2H1V3V5_SPOFR|nr:protein LLP homolog [Spodoptera frugiperda]